MEIVPPEGTIELPRGIADTDGVVGFVSAVDGLDRLDLRTGRQIWGTSGARYPLALWRSRLIALRTLPGPPAGLQLVTLDVDQPDTPLLSSDTIPVPERTLTRPNSYIDVSIDREDLILRWSATQTYEGGAPPTPEIEARASHAARGCARVSLSTGRVDLEPGEPLIRQPSTEFVESIAGDWYTEAWLAGEDRVRLVLSQREGHQQLSLHFEGASGETSPARVVLAEGTALVSVVTLDRRHVLVRDEAGRPALSADVFSIPKRAKVGAITWEPGTADLVVINDRVLYLVRHVERAATAHSLGAAAIVLKARDLQGDQVLWEHSLAREQTGPRRVRPKQDAEQ